MSAVGKHSDSISAALKQEKKNPLPREFYVCRSTFGTAFAFPPEQTLIICISTETSGQNVGACGMYLPCFISADMIIF